MNILLFFSNFLLQKCQKSRQRLFFSVLHPNKVRQIQNYLLQEIKSSVKRIRIIIIDLVININQRYTFHVTSSLLNIDRISVLSDWFPRPIIVSQKCVSLLLLNARAFYSLLDGPDICMTSTPPWLKGIQSYSMYCSRTVLYLYVDRQRS